MFIMMCIYRSQSTVIYKSSPSRYDYLKFTFNYYCQRVHGQYFDYFFYKFT